MKNLRDFPQFLQEHNAKLVDPSRLYTAIDLRSLTGQAEDSSEFFQLRDFPEVYAWVLDLHRNGHSLAASTTVFDRIFMAIDQSLPKDLDLWLIEQFFIYAPEYQIR